MSTLTNIDHVSPAIAMSQGLAADHIPQLDGLESHSQHAPSYKCDNCGKIFGRKEELDAHNEMNQFGCEECCFCFTSKYLADLHELETHPEDVDFYIINHVPETTKRDFANGKRCF